MTDPDGSLSFYFFDIDDNLLFLPTNLYLWNAERKIEQAISSGEFAAIQNDLGRKGKWQPWAVRDETFRDFRDVPGVPADRQAFSRDLHAAIAGDRPWQGPSWPLLVHAAEKQRPIAMVSARGHEPKTVEAGLHTIVARGLLKSVPPILGIYTVTNPGVRARLGATDPAMTVPSIKKIAIKDAVAKALSRYGAAPPHRFGMSDDDPSNVVLAISAMRDCKVQYPQKRFFVINTNHEEYVKLEIFPMAHPVTTMKSGERLLGDLSSQGAGSPPPATSTFGGSASIYVSNMDRAIAFYTGTLGLRLRTRIGSEWAELDAGNGLVLGLHPAHPPDTVAPGVAGAINVELLVTKPLKDVVAALEVLGAKFKGSIEEYENVHLAWLFDPDGNAVVLAQQINAG